MDASGDRCCRQGALIWPLPRQMVDPVLIHAHTLMDIDRGSRSSHRRALVRHGHTADTSWIKGSMRLSLTLNTEPSYGHYNERLLVLMHARELQNNPLVGHLYA